MSELQIACIVWNGVLGVLIMCSYYFFLFHRIGAYGIDVKAEDDKKKRERARLWLWAPFNDVGGLYSIWVFFAAISTMSYIDIFVEVICMRDWSNNTTYFAVANLCFLFCSFLYAPLIFYAFKASETGGSAMRWRECAVMLDLFLVAVSAGCMLVYMVLESMEWWIIKGCVILAFHCTFFDFFLWGGMWLFNVQKEGIYHEITKLRALGAPFSTTNAFIGLRITHTDRHMGAKA